MRSKVGWCLLGVAGLALVAPSARADDGGKRSSVSVERIEMTPTRDGFYDAAVSLAVHDAKLDPGGVVGFSITIAHVHDVDEAIDKVHDPIRMLGQDLQQGYFDVRRQP